MSARDDEEFDPQHIERAARAAQSVYEAVNRAAWPHVVKAVIQSYQEAGPKGMFRQAATTALEEDARWALGEYRMRLEALVARSVSPIRPKFGPGEALELLDKVVAQAKETGKAPETP